VGRTFVRSANHFPTVLSKLGDKLSHRVTLIDSLGQLAEILYNFMAFSGHSVAFRVTRTKISHPRQFTVFPFLHFACPWLT
jgi:hypothetical protein